MSLNPARFHSDEVVNHNWTVTVEVGTTLEDVMKTDFFANIANFLVPYDHIRVNIDSGEWYAELLVVNCSRNWAKTIKLCHHQLAEVSEEGGSDAYNQYTAKFQGPHKKWCVIRNSDKEEVKEGFANKEDANIWLASHVLAM